MKIAKVDRIKTAVGREGGSKITGFIYPDPRKGRDATIDAIVRKRCDATKVLYNVFDEGELKDDVSNEAKKVAKLFNAGIKELKGNKNKNIPERITENLNAATLKEGLGKARNSELSFRKNNDKGIGGNNLDFTEAAVSEALDKLLKKCFRKPDIKASLKTLMLNMFGDGSYPFSDEDDSQLEGEHGFIKKLVEDYSKSRVRQFIPKSVRNKNMAVQPCKGKETAVLEIPATAGMSEDKKRAKAALNRFLSEYATLDGNKRHCMRLKLRRLIDLYYYGMDNVQPGDFDEWKDHEVKRGSIDPFAKVINKGIFKGGENVSVLDADATSASFREKNIERYRYSIGECEKDAEGILFFTDSDLNRFWIKRIEDETEKLYKGFSKDTEPFRFTSGYISEKVWKGLIGYLSVKYISLGKAVYNFTLSDITGNVGKMDLGILDSGRDAMTSFEYEDIKAEETLQREIAVNIAFAANHLSNATVSIDGDDADMLVYSEEELRKAAKPEILRNVLQFFGGKSKWDRFKFEDYFSDETDFLYGIKSIIYSLRNSSFHFKTTVKNAGSWNNRLIADMFRYDCRMLGTLKKDKLCSNNLPMFYGEKSLEKVLGKLYSHRYERASQVPSYNAVFTRTKFAEILAGYGISPVFHDNGTREKWLSALYYLYKEIYYNGFLQDEESLGRLLKFADELPVMYDSKGRVQNDSKPADDFKKAIAEYKRVSHSLAELCQYIMTEHNRQNSGTRKKKSAYASTKNPGIYEHYKMLLYKGLETAFKMYLKDNEEVFGFTATPFSEPKEIPDLKDFLPGYVSSEMEEIATKVENDEELLKWYVASRFLNPKQVNQLAGSFRSYRQYIDDIRRRASETGNAMPGMKSTVMVDDILSVLEVVTGLAGATSNVLEDYFDDKDDYARYLSKFVDFGLADGESFPSAVLGNFCREEVGDHKIGIFHDGENPILNRNVVMCKLYGAGDITTRAVGKLTKEDIADYYRLDAAIKVYREKGECTDAAQQAELRKFQEMKNRAELRNIVEYSEILNEFQGQLVNWTYLRERDLMYFQLGLHYLCLNNETPKPEGYRVIKAGDKEISGAVLYQIAAMYTCGLPLYYKDDNGDYTSQEYDKKGILPSTDNALISIGAKVPYFLRYSKIIKELGDNRDVAEIYLAGLELFENIAEHDDCIELRKYIDHFKYFSRANRRSILDIYSEVFDRFFSYDSKYRKNVVNMAYNILLSHCVVSAFSFGTGEKLIHLSKETSETKDRATVSLRAKNGLSSDKYTYNIKQPDKTTKDIKLCARGYRFLEDVAKLLCSPDIPSENVIRDPAEEDRKAIEKFNLANGNDQKHFEEGKQASGSKTGKKHDDKNPSHERNGKKSEQQDKDWQGYKQENTVIGTSLADKLKNLKLQK